MHLTDFFSAWRHYCCFLTTETNTEYNISNEAGALVPALLPSSCCYTASPAGSPQTVQWYLPCSSHKLRDTARTQLANTREGPAVLQGARLGHFTPLCLAHQCLTSHPISFWTNSHWSGCGTGVRAQSKRGSPGSVSSWAGRRKLPLLPALQQLQGEVGSSASAQACQQLPEALKKVFTSRIKTLRNKSGSDSLSGDKWRVSPLKILVWDWCTADGIQERYRYLQNPLNIFSDINQVFFLIINALFPNGISIK